MQQVAVTCAAYRSQVRTDVYRGKIINSLDPLALRSLLCLHACGEWRHARACAVFVCTAYLSVLDLWGWCASQQHMQARIKKQVVLLALVTPSYHAECNGCPTQRCSAQVLHHRSACMFQRLLC